VHPEDREKFERLCEVIEQADPGGQATELRFNMNEGDAGRQAMRWVFCQTGQIEFRGRTAALVVLDDMTRMKDLEQIVSTREKLSIIGQLAAGIAHEIRNPLSGININVSTLEHVVRNLETVSPEERRKIGEIVAQAKAASEKIATVIRRVMDFTKPVPPKLDRIDVNQVVREALNFSSATLRKGGISVGTELSPDLPMCNADPRLLEQVMLNLITNAVQAMENENGQKRLGVGTVQENGTVLIRVFDNGPGVPVHLREKIFDPFYTTRKTGHGIGLSFSHRVIENHGGTLTASGNDWGGAEFRIALPLETGRATV
jgi:signal transduction histidine kinase